MASRGGIRESLAITPEQMDDMKKVFDNIDSDQNGTISVSELGAALEICGFKLPAYEVRDLVREFDSKIKDGRLDIDEFRQLYARIKSEKDLGHTFKKNISKRENIQAHGGTSSASVEGTTHTVKKEEQVAFSNWINSNLKDDPDCAKYLPLNPDSGSDLYEKGKDGILLCKMINKSQPGTIDERVINKKNLNVYRCHENLTLALNSAQAIGCNIVNIGCDDLEKGKPHLVLGLLWQVIRIGLLSDINLHEHPGLVALLKDGETLEDLMRLGPEDILIRWVNYHLAKSTCGREIANFSGDIKDSVAYIHLLNQIAPRDKGVTTTAEHESDQHQRAEKMLQEAEKIECRSFVTAKDVVAGNPKLNLAFVANLFNNYPALDTPEEVDLEGIVEETREEKMYRNWMNSMGVSPYVNHLYSDLNNGIIIFQLYDIIKPGVVDWKKVVQKFNKMRRLMEQIGNCNYAVELGTKECHFSLVGIDGKDIYDGNPTLTLALVWQLMKAYTLSILSRLAREKDGDADGHPIVDKEIVSWANEKLKASGKTTSIRNFQDPDIADAVVILDLVDAIKPGAVKYDLVKKGSSPTEKLDNAKYAISICRQIGARVYAMPEDIVEVKAKMVMTIFACLMIRDFQAPAK